MKVLLSWMYRRSMMPFSDLLWSTVLNDTLERNAKKSHANVEQFFALMIDLQKQQPTSRAEKTTLLQTLLAANEKAHQSESVAGHRSTLSDKELYANILTFSFAGSETTAGLITAVLYFLCLTANQTLKAALVQEVQAELASSEVVTSIDQADRLPLLRATLRETNRLMPVAPGLMFNTVSTEEGHELPNGMHVRPEDGIVINSLAIMRDEAVFPDPDTFRPTRWIDAGPQKLKEMDRYFLTFGGGTRVCPGQRLANVEATCYLAAIIRNFDFKLNCDSSEVKYVFKFTAQLSKLPLVFTCRK
jgi:cytochrome P450